MYFPDLDKCRYHSGPLDADSWQAPLLAIGWLEHPYRFSCGKTPEGMLARLQNLVAAATEAHPHYNFRGLHCCSLCEAERSTSEALVQSHVNMLIPGIGVVYAAPAGITHYIEAHSYLPPIEFMAAVSLCPTYGSAAFYEALRNANQGREPPMQTWNENVRATRDALLKAIEAHRGRDV
jgi:hypothetical protein